MPTVPGFDHPHARLGAQGRAAADQAELGDLLRKAEDLVRIAKATNAPATIAEGAKQFGAGNVGLTVEDAERNLDAIKKIVERDNQGTFALNHYWVTRYNGGNLRDRLDDQVKGVKRSPFNPRFSPADQPPQPSLEASNSGEGRGRR